MNWTKEMRWNQLHRAAVILGLVPTGMQGMRQVNNMLQARMKSKRVEKRKEGKAQSSRAWYRARKDSR